jgi:hypothetical protein
MIELEPKKKVQDEFHKILTAQIKNQQEEKKRAEIRKIDVGH